MIKKRLNVRMSGLGGQGAVTAAQSADLTPYAKKGYVVQRLNAFDNPEGSIFSADGRLVASAAQEGLIRWREVK